MCQPIFTTRETGGKMQEIQAFLRVFKKLPEEVIENNKSLISVPSCGVVFYQPHEEFEETVESAIKTVFPETESFSKTFHTNWQSIFEKEDEELYVEQVMHYFSTYGLEFLNIDPKNYVYLPNEVSQVPELRKFYLIETISRKEALEKVNQMISGIALSQQTVNDIVSIFNFYSETISLDKITNKDLKIKLIVANRIVPENPDECMKVINYLLTGNLSFVKSKENIYFFGYCNDITKIKYIEKILEERINELATVFYRYKKHIIYLKHISKEARKSVNLIRRRAIELYVPKCNDEFLTTKILKEQEIELSTLTNLSISNLVKIYNKLMYCALAPNMNIDAYRIRNGKIFVKKSERNLDVSSKEKILAWCTTIRTIIQERLQSSNYRIRLPRNIDLAFPESEKAFIGEISIYSTIKQQGANVIGVSWNEDEDLDLSLLTSTQKYGWNGVWRNDNTILYSGDMTRAGAESFYLKTQNTQFLVELSNYRQRKEVEYDLFFATSSEDAWKDKAKHYTVDSNDVNYSTKLSIDKAHQLLGLYNPNQNFVFLNLKLGSGAVSFPSNIIQDLIQYFTIMSVACLKLTDVFQEYNEDVEIRDDIQVIDLEKDLSKATIIDLCLEKKDER